MSENVHIDSEIFEKLGISSQEEEIAFNRIYQKIEKILKDEIGITKNFEIKSSLESDLLLDSVAMMEMVLSIEHEYGIEVADEEISKLKEVGDIVYYVYQKVGKELN